MLKISKNSRFAIFFPMKGEKLQNFHKLKCAFCLVLKYEEVSFTSIQEDIVKRQWVREEEII